MPSRPARSASAAQDAGRSGAEGRELEWQLAAADLGLVRRWLGRHPTLEGLTIRTLPAQELHDTYLDTRDWRVFRAGFALRLREKQGIVEATLKGLHSARHDVADREEITEAFGSGDPRELARTAGPVGRRIRHAAGSEPLQPLFEVRTSRRRFSVRAHASSRILGEIALDETRFAKPNGGGDGRRILRRVEIEATDGSSAPLEHLAERLRKECRLRRATENKFVAGLRTAGISPPPLPDAAHARTHPPQPAPGGPGSGAQSEGDTEPPLRMRSSMSASYFACAALRRLIAQWRAHEPAALGGASPETLHALRVTARRMDAVLSLFGPYLPRAISRIRPKLKGILDTMGGVRDLDIVCGATDSFRGTLAQTERREFDPLMRHLESERARAGSRMQRALQARATRQWLQSLDTAVGKDPSSPPGRSGASHSRKNTAAREAVPGLIRERYRKLRKRIQRLTRHSSLRDYHKVRVRAKKLRYSIEIVAATYGKPADELLSALRKLQNELGTQHDSDAISRYVSRLAGRPPRDFTPETLFQLGRMAELHAEKAVRMAEAAIKPWRKVRGKRWKALRSRMKERACS